MAFIDCASWKPQNQNGEFVFAYRYPETNLSTFYNPQNEMFVNRKTKRYIFKTKRIFFGYPSIIQKMWL